MIGINGTGLTHTIFFQPGLVFMQVVPLGTAWAVEVCYARLARNVGSEYMEYMIQAEQSSLIDNYNKDDMVIRDLVAFKGADWFLMNLHLKKIFCLNTKGFNNINFANRLLHLDILCPV